MAKHTENDPKPVDPPKPEDAAAARRQPAPPPDPQTPSTAEQEKIDLAKASKDPPDGRPDPNAQIHIGNRPHVANTLLGALGELPQIPALDGLRANYQTYSDEELVKALDGLPIVKEDANGLAQRDALVARIKAGDFARR